MELNWEAIKNAKIFTQETSSQQAATEATDELISSLGYNPYNVENIPFLGGVFIWINGQYFGGIRR